MTNSIYRFIILVFLVSIAQQATAEYAISQRSERTGLSCSTDIIANIYSENAASEPYTIELYHSTNPMPIATEVGARGVYSFTTDLQGNFRIVITDGLGCVWEEAVEVDCDDQGTDY